jgi:ATP-dependent DNA ligase
MNVPALITYPARPIQGGRLELAPPKRGLWYAEPKYNGWRVLAHAPSGMCFTRHLEPLSIAKEFAKALDLLHRAGELMGIEWFDCEGLERRHAIGRGTLVVLDAIISGNYVQRRDRLVAGLGEPLSIESRLPEHAIALAPSFSANESLAIYQRLREINQLWGCDFYEGVVMKKADSLYPIQLRSGTEECRAMVKHRFVT